jgi:DNA-binding transcriptional MocR family regulator
LDDPSAQATLQTQLVGEISTSITTGRLSPGTRLPGTRALSEQLGVSRNTVLLAFATLASEEFVETRERAGTFVSEAYPEPAQFDTPAQTPKPARAATPVICDFKLEAVDPDLFPAPVWRRMMMRRMNSPEFNLTKVSDPQGYSELRASLCRFLGTSRGMNISPGQQDADVFEVDFDSDFRYEGSPNPALQTLDRNGRFIYAGSFALTIGPGLRIGYLVMPPALVGPALDALRLLDHAYPCQTQGAPWLDQAVLCDFLDSGGYDKQLRRLRTTYMERRDVLVQSLQDHFGDCDLIGKSSGSHVIWRLPDHLPDAPTFQTKARSAGVAVNTLQHETITGPEFLSDRDRLLLLGYADLQPETIRKAVERMAQVLG